MWDRLFQKIQTSPLLQTLSEGPVILYFWYGSGSAVCQVACTLPYCPLAEAARCLDL